MALRLGLRAREAHGRVLLLWRNDTLRLLDRGLLQIRGLELVIVRILDYEVRLVTVLLRGLRVVVGLMLRDDLFDGNALELGLPLGLDALDLLVVREMFEVLGVIVRLVRLCLGRGVELL